MVWSAKYSSFGKVYVDPASTVENNLRFAGQYEDNETGLHYNWHRFYDPRVGRYLRVDPVGLKGGVNLFAYVLNNPKKSIDPWGLFDWDGSSEEEIIDEIERRLLYGDPPTPPKSNEPQCYEDHSHNSLSIFLSSGILFQVIWNAV